MIFTLMSYNIERGFHSRNHLLEEQRLQAAQRIVQQVRPDLLALTEACYGGPNSHGIKMDYQQLFYFRHGQFGSYPVIGPRKGDEGGNCLLSQFPMQGEAIQLSYKGAVRGKVQLEDKILTVDVVHPSYSVDDNKKISTLRPLISSRQEPYLLTGDLNTIHPDDKYDWDQLVCDLQSYDPEKAAWIVENWRKAEFVTWLLEQGLEDTFPVAARQSTVPTSYSYGEKIAGVRMDFCFKSNDLKVKEAYVLKNEDTEIASDHYPIVVTFKI
ncbi:MAG: hypothetical protein A2822_04415 [Candidatus Staskawiczbacteria bacterium RIFCSPHIGHO2_01_FULL_41_41]|uniref:Endonuclease/exonuclease/phosphatase domain-containing protein n=1 Tax=Candidatus Staskawiczbacteria bacterium RIFCSPHIGHO2_01_FULL_41_41 TaxID=1802203 RepID=A0A1G2HT85_9BACT|nr:MAG: hypothetical protein A2822_04415 [Candidatus Staskawiczbacteria bacterium RIFCSPHIGHO2_01_FULL_41_41]